jgi:hypothetical protein
MLFLSELFNNTDKSIEQGLTAPLAQFLWFVQPFCMVQPTYNFVLLTFTSNFSGPENQNLY